MRHLVLLRGCPGAGKSTFVTNNGLDQYTLCPDKLRLLYQTPVLTEEGVYRIFGKHDGAVWKDIFRLLEERMKRGEFTVIDAVHSKAVEFGRYKELKDKYRYHMWCVDFSGIPIEKAIANNSNREEYKRVPVPVLENIYSRYATQPIPRWIDVIKPAEFTEAFNFTPLDLSKWDKIHHIGDIHGCYAPLKEYFENNPFNENELYIFIGDLLDRGTENAEVLRFIFSIMDKPNVILIQGNHERWLWDWANGTRSGSKEFENSTKMGLERAGISTKLTRQLYRKLCQMVYYTYDGKVVVVSHGGISKVPDNFNFMASDQLIRGVGVYSTEINKIFCDKTPPWYYQIHGHRNTQGAPIQNADRGFNLEGNVEFNGHLRIVTLDKANGFTTVEIKNTVVNTTYENMSECAIIKEPVNVSPEDKSFLESLRANKHIKESVCGSFSGFNFTRDAFLDNLWDSQTIKARGLFIKTKEDAPNYGHIVGRSYNKCFRLNERPETKLDNLGNSVTMPVRIYKKYNGFLGILGYDAETDELLYLSKSTSGGSFAELFKEIFFEDIGSRDVKNTLNGIKEHLKENNVSAVFEVIEPKKDPHIIEYSNRHIVLLDLVKNTVNFEKKGYEDVVSFALSFSFTVKDKCFEFEEFLPFLEWIQATTSPENQEEVEGYVVEDVNGFMFKIKSPFYGFWKHMRAIKESMMHKGGRDIRTGSLLTPEANEFYAWLKAQPLRQIRKDIISLRKRYLTQKDTGVECHPCPGLINCTYKKDDLCNYTLSLHRACKFRVCCHACSFNPAKKVFEYMSIL